MFLDSCGHPNQNRTSYCRAYFHLHHNYIIQASVTGHTDTTNLFSELVTVPTKVSEIYSSLDSGQYSRL